MKTKQKSKQQTNSHTSKTYCCARIHCTLYGISSFVSFVISLQNVPLALNSLFTHLQPLTQPKRGGERGKKEEKREKRKKKRGKKEKEKLRAASRLATEDPGWRPARRAGGHVANVKSPLGDFTGDGDVPHFGPSHFSRSNP